MIRFCWRAGLLALAFYVPMTADFVHAGPNSPTGVEVQQLPERADEPGVAAVTILVSNRGPNVADAVTVTQMLPPGCEVRQSLPVADATPGRLQWSLGALPVGEQRSLRVKLAIPTNDPRTELASTVTASWHNSVTGSASLTVYRPSLALTVTGPETGIVGEPASFQFAVTNRGSATLKGVSLQTILPAGLHHQAGNDLENELGELGAGETRVVQLEVTPTQAGELLARAKVSATGVEPLERKVTLKSRVVKVSISMNGPGQCCSGWPCTYDVSVSNDGPEAVSGLRATVQLPKGLSFVRGTEPKIYDAVTHSLHWTADQLPAGAKRTYAFYAISTETGEQACRSAISMGGRALKQATVTTKVVAGE